MRVHDDPNPYAYDAERLDWFSRFTLTPVDPDDIAARLSAGAVLETADIPRCLSTKAHTDCETGVGLYRMVQLWGTPNVPGTTAGALDRDREQTTWQYLFEVTYDREEDDDPAIPASFLLSVYDYRTDVSAGLSGFRAGDADRGTVLEPATSAVPSVDLPPDEFVAGVVGLVLNMVDEPVPATYKELWL